MSICLVRPHTYPNNMHTHSCVEGEANLTLTKKSATDINFRLSLSLVSRGSAVLPPPPQPPNSPTYFVPSGWSLSLSWVLHWPQCWLDPVEEHCVAFLWKISILLWLVLQLGNFNYGQDLSQVSEQGVPFKRKLSKREKKEKKKQEKLAKIKVRDCGLRSRGATVSLCKSEGAAASLAMQRSRT